MQVDIVEMEVSDGKYNHGCPGRIRLILLGMHMMSEGLHKLAGSKLRRFLNLTFNRRWQFLPQLQLSSKQQRYHRYGRWLCQRRADEPTIVGTILAPISAPITAQIVSLILPRLALPNRHWRIVISFQTPLSKH